MNWYKKAQAENNWRKILTVFGLTAVLGLASLWGISLLDLKKKYYQNPQEVESTLQQQQEIENKSQQHQENRQPKQIIPQESLEIDLNKIYQIESSGGKDLYNEKSGAMGPFQFMPQTWDDLTKKIGKNWPWEDALDYEKSRQVADYYYNRRIPEMLRYFGIPDTIETRIAAYDWGIGYLNNAYKQYKDKWLIYAPTETKEYVEKYNSL